MDPLQQKSSSIATPIAIIFGFSLIALAVYFSGIGKSNPSATPKDEALVAVGNGKISPITEKDYIRGNPNAPIMLVEYSDYDCPFCKEFHTNMTRIMNEYGVGGKVAWVYRQFPLAELHPNSPRISEAALCVGEIGNEIDKSDDAFWNFTDFVFTERGIDELTNISRLPEYAELSGVNRQAFETCLKSGRHQKLVEDRLKEGAEAGIKSTPHTFIIVGNQQIAVEGAQTYVMLKGTIDALLDQLEGRETILEPEEDIIVPTS